MRPHEMGIITLLLHCYYTVITLWCDQPKSGMKSPIVPLFTFDTHFRQSVQVFGNFDSFSETLSQLRSPSLHWTTLTISTMQGSFRETGGGGMFRAAQIS